MKKKKLFLIWIIFFIITPISGTYAVESDKATMLMMTNLGTAHLNNGIKLSGDGNYIFAKTYEPGAANITLIKVPESFSTEQDLVWKIDVEMGYDLEISSNASRLIYVDAIDESISCISRESMTPIWEYSIPVGSIGKADLSQNGEYLVYSYYDSTIYHIRLVNAADNSELWDFESTSMVAELDITNNGKSIVSLLNGTIIYFDKEGYKWDDSLQFASMNPRLTADGSRILVCNLTGAEHVVSLYDDSGTILWRFSDELFSSRGIDLAVNSNEIIVATQDNIVSSNNKIYGLNTSSATPIWTINSGIMQRFARISANGKIGIVSDYDYNVHLINIQTGNIFMTHSLENSIHNVEISEDGTIAAVLDISGNMVVYSIEVSNDSTNGSPGILNQFIEGFTNLNNIYSLVATFAIGLIIGGLLFRRRKK